MFSSFKQKKIQLVWSRNDGDIQIFFWSVTFRTPCIFNIIEQQRPLSYGEGKQLHLNSNPTCHGRSFFQFFLQGDSADKNT